MEVRSRLLRVNTSTHDGCQNFAASNTSHDGQYVVSTAMLRDRPVRERETMSPTRGGRKGWERKLGAVLRVVVCRILKWTVGHSGSQTQACGHINQNKIGRSIIRHRRSLQIMLNQLGSRCSSMLLWRRQRRATTTPHHPKLQEVCKPALLWARYWSTHPRPEHQQNCRRHQCSCKDKGITKRSSTRHMAG